jgi:RNA polymerase sigma factor (sigma-70 family)
MAGGRRNALVQHIRKLAAVQTTQTLSDRDLLDRFLAHHDEAAFAALVERHGAMVLGICRRVLRHAQDAEDASQAAFLVLARKAASIRKQESLASFLHSVAYHVAANLKRDSARRSAREATRPEVAQADVTGEVSWREVQAILDEELARLPEHYRAPLVLCYLEGKTRDEAAQQLGWSPDTLRGRLDRGRERLRARLTRRGLTLSAALLASALAEGSAAEVLPPTFVVLTVKAGLLVAAGKMGAAGGASARVAALTEGALRVLFAARAKAFVGVLGTALAAGIGMSLLASGGPGGEQTAATPETFRNRTSQRTDEAKVAVGGPRQANRPQRVASWRAHAALTGHSGAVRALAFSVDGSRLVSGGDEGQVRVWDVGAARELLTLKSAKARPFRAVAFGQGGNAVAAGNDDGGVLVWDLRIGQEPRAVVPGRGHDVLALTFGDDGRSLAWARCGGAVEWDAGLEGLRAPLPGQGGEVQCVALSPDGRKAAWGMKDGGVRLWDAPGNKELGHYRPHRHEVRCVGLSSDGGLVGAVDPDATLKVLDVATGHQQMVRQVGTAGTGDVLALAFSPDRKVVATAGSGGTVGLWDTQSARELAGLAGHRDTVHALAFSPDGQFLAAAASDGEIRVWTSRP